MEILGFTRLMTVLLLLAHLCHGFTFHLHRAPLNSLNMTELVLRDKVRHERLLGGNDAIDFPVGGDVYFAGEYYAKVSLGTPPVDFHVQIDTGSDNLWVTCSSCTSCPKSSPIAETAPHFYDPSRSSTSSPVINCHDERCRMGFPDTSSCSTDGRDLCVYSNTYHDQSGTSGFYMSDVLHYNTTGTSNHTFAPVVFGCSNLQIGHLSEPLQITDGIMGLGRNGLSIISQLASQGSSPRAFSHCFNGDAEGGGGLLVLGEIVEPNITYSPLIRKSIFYSLNLRSISINGKILPIDPDVFSNSPSKGAMFDTGTTLAYLPEKAYKHIKETVDHYIMGVTPIGEFCYSVTLSINDIFPSITLMFKGEAALILSPIDYLTPNIPGVDDGIWCMGFKTDPIYTILGDLVLKNKMIVYDLVNQRIGWKTYNLNITTIILHNDARKSSNKFTLWSIGFITYVFLMG